MKKLLFLLLLTSNAVFAQTVNLDSLQKNRNYAHIYAPDSLGFRLISSKSGHEIFTFEGKKVSAKSYENTYKWSRNGYTYFNAIEKNGKQALLSAEGKVLFTHEYDNLDIISKDAFRVRKDDKMGLINAKNEFLIPLDTVALFILCRRVNSQMSSSPQNIYFCDSVVQLIDNQFFIQDFQKHKKLLLPIQKGMYDLATSGYSKNKMLISFEIKKNDIIGRFIPNEVYIKWTFENDKFSNIGLFKEKDSTRIYSYTFGDAQENEKKEISYHTILDENGQVVLRGNWEKGVSIQGGKDFIIIKDIFSKIDTVKSVESKENPLLKESCNTSNQQKKFFISCSLIRLQDKKEICKFITENQSAETTCDMAFWGENKCIACEKGKYGIMDLQGKWLIEPQFAEIKAETEEIALVKKDEKNYFIDQSLKMVSLPDGNEIEIRASENGRISGMIENKKGSHLFAYNGIERLILNSFKDKNAMLSNFDLLRMLSPCENVYEILNKRGRMKGYIVFFKNGKKRFFPYEKYSFSETTPFHYIILQKKSQKMGDFSEGLMDIKTGKMTLKCDFDAIEFRYGNYFCKKGDSIYWVDKTGEIFKKRKSYKAQIRDNQAIQALIKEKGYKEEQDFNFSGITTEDELENISKTVTLKKSVQYGYINAEGKEIAPPTYLTLLKINDSILVGTNVDNSTKINRYTAESTPLAFQVKVSHSLPPYAQKQDSFAILDEFLHLKSGFDYAKMGQWENFFLLVTTKDKKQGIADKSGKLLVPCKYEKIENSFVYEQHFGHYHFDTAFAKPANYFGIYENGKKIDIYNRYFQPISIGEYEKVVKESHVEKCIVAMKNGKWGVISDKNEEIIPFIYSKATKINLGESYKPYITVETSKEIMRYNYKGKIMLRCGKGDLNEGKNLYMLSTKRENTVFDAKGAILGHFKGEIQVAEYGGLAFMYDSLFMVKLPKNNKWNLLNKKGEKILPWDCDSINVEESEYGYIIYKGELEGIVDKTGKICLYPQKNKIIALKGEDLALTYLKNQSDFYLHFDGKPYFPLGYDYYKMLNRERCAVSIAGKSGCVDNEGKIIVPLEWENLNFLENGKENLYLARMGCDYYLLDSTGKKLYANSFEMIARDRATKTKAIFFLAIQNGKYGLLDDNGKMIIPFLYDKMENDKNGNYIVGLNGKQGLVSAEGKEILPIIYDAMEGVQNDFYGYAGIRLSKGGLQGHYYHKTKKLIPPIYAEVEFCEKQSSFIVRLTNGKKGILAKNGQELLPPIYNNIETSRFSVRTDSNTQMDFDAFWVEKEGIKSYFYFNKNANQWQMEAYGE